MEISYNRMWVLRIDKKMSKATEIAPNTMTISLKQKSLYII